MNPSVTALEPGFADPPDMSGTKTYGVTFDLTNSGTPDIVAGFPQVNPNPDPNAPKPFEVAGYLSGAGQNIFDNTHLYPQYAGSYYLVNDPNHPNFEFQIDHFSQLYLQMTGKALTSTSTFGMGAYATSAQDIGISDEVFPLQPISVGQATVPVTPPRRRRRPPRRPWSRRPST